MAGLGAAYMTGKSIIDTVKYAIAMSNITISHEATIHPKMSEAYVEAYLKTATWGETRFE